MVHTLYEHTCTSTLCMGIVCTYMYTCYVCYALYAKITYVNIIILCTKYGLGESTYVHNNNCPEQTKAIHKLHMYTLSLSHWRSLHHPIAHWQLIFNDHCITLLLTGN